jgi:hypothetical protein
MVWLSVSKLGERVHLFRYQPVQDRFEHSLELKLLPQKIAVCAVPGPHRE